MARARKEASNQSQRSIQTIRHKARAKQDVSLSKALKPRTRTNKIGKPLKAGVQVRSQASNPITEKRKLQQPIYRGTMKESAGRPQAVAQSDHKAQQELAVSESEDFQSTDDMEAGYSDLEQEEMVTLKKAREEDEREAREEARLRQEKLERRKKL